MATSTIETRKLIQPQTLSKYNYIWIRLDNEVQKRWSLNKSHYQLGWTKFKVEEVIKRLDQEQILEVRCVQYLMNSTASSKIQVHLEQDQAWEIEMSTEEGTRTRFVDPEIGNRQTDENHQHNILDLPRINFYEIFPKELPREVQEIKERIVKKNLNQDDTMSDVSHDPLDGSPFQTNNENYSLFAERAKAIKTVITSKAVLNFAKKEINVHHRLVKLKNNLSKLDEKETRNIILSQMEEIDLGLTYLNNMWIEARNNYDFELQEEEKILINDTEITPAYHLGSIFQDIKAEYNDGIKSLGIGTLVIETIKLLEVIEDNSFIEDDFLADREFSTYSWAKTQQGLCEIDLGEDVYVRKDSKEFNEDYNSTNKMAPGSQDTDDELSKIEVQKHKVPNLYEELDFSTTTK